MTFQPQSTRLTVLISGSGTNLEALIKACNNNELPNAQIVRVISNRKAACRGHTCAAQHDLKAHTW